MGSRFSCSCIRAVQTLLLTAIFVLIVRFLLGPRHPRHDVEVHQIKTKERTSYKSFSLVRGTNHSQIFKPFSRLPQHAIEPPKEAIKISAAELMSRPLPLDRTKAPRLLHQSWYEMKLPPRMQEWSTSCRRVNPDWEYVLWNDTDNRILVEKYASWFLKTYDDLDFEIYRADAVRNIYMHIFGG